MGRIDEKYRYNITPIARETSIIKGEKYRFTVLTEGLIRIEFSEEGIFEDRATQTVINREFSEVDFNVKEDAEKVVIDTNQIKLTYYKNEKPKTLATRKNDKLDGAVKEFNTKGELTSVTTYVQGNQINSVKF